MANRGLLEAYGKIIGNDWRPCEGGLVEVLVAYVGRPTCGVCRTAAGLIFIIISQGPLEAHTMPMEHYVSLLLDYGSIGGLTGPY